MLHRTARERYEKLRKVFTRLKRNFNRDDLDDFIQTANSLPEWIRRDATVTAEQKAALERFVVPESLDWQICNQIANQQKHVLKASPRSKARQVSKAVNPYGNGSAYKAGWKWLRRAPLNANCWGR
jgi:hypothetical protein